MDLTANAVTLKTAIDEVREVMVERGVEYDPQLELTMIAAFKRGYSIGEIDGIDHAVSAIMDGLEDAVAFAAERVKNKGE